MSNSERRWRGGPRYGDLPGGADPDALLDRQAADRRYSQELAQDLTTPLGAELGARLPCELGDYGPDLGP